MTTFRDPASSDGEMFEIAFARVLRRLPDGSWEAVAWIDGERTTRGFTDRAPAESWLLSLPPAVRQSASLDGAPPPRPDRAGSDGRTG